MISKITEIVEIIKAGTNRGWTKIGTGEMPKHGIPCFHAEYFGMLIERDLLDL